MHHWNWLFCISEMSAIWKCFKLDSEYSATATCTVFNLGISHGGKERAALNTTNMKQHLKNISKTYFDFTAATRLKTLSQPTLKEAFKSFLRTVKRITSKLAGFIASDGQPLSVVANVEFRHLMKHLEPRYELLSHHYFTNTALPLQQLMWAPASVH